MKTTSLFLSFILTFIGQIVCHTEPNGIETHHPLVQRTSKAQFHSFTDEDGIKEPETITEHYELINAFLEGWNAIIFFPNIADCSKYSQIFLQDNSDIRWKMKMESKTMKTFTAVRLITKLISNQYAESYLYCHMTLYDSYIYVLEQMEIYDNDELEWLQAFLQNLIGNSIEINNLSVKVEIAEDNGDNRLKHFILGRVLYRLMDFDPIEEGTVVTQTPFAKIYKLIETAIHVQQILNSDKNKTQALESSSIKIKQDQRVINQYLEKRAEEDRHPIVLYSGRHPLVGDNIIDRIHTDERPDDELTSAEKTEKYIAYAFMFYWSAQMNSVGQIAGNLTVCTTETEKFGLSLEAIYYEYKNESYGEAGRSTYTVLKTIDPIVFACYFATFEFKDAFTIYASTVQDIEKLLYNFCHNLGMIYDYVEEAVYRGMDAETAYQTRGFWIRMGAITGGTFHALFEDPVNYYPYNPAIHKQEL